MALFWTRKRYLTPAVPPESYYQGIRGGYRQNGLPVAALKRARDHAVREVRQETERINAIFAGRAKPPKKGKNQHER